MTACAGGPAGEPTDPNEGMLRDFLDGKFDAAGHPINAKVIDAPCGDRLSSTCEGAIPSGATSGSLIANVRLRVLARPSRGDIVTVTLADAAGGKLASDTLTVARLRDQTGRSMKPV